MSEELEVEVTPKPKRGPKPKAVSGVSPEILEFLSSMNASNMAAIAEIIKESKKPSEMDQRKIDKEDTELKRKQQARMAEGKAQAEAREMRMKGCPHASVIPATGVSKHCWRGQIHSPKNERAYTVPMCTRCNSTTPKIYLTAEQLQNGINMDQIPGLNIERLLTWSEGSGNIEGVQKFLKERQIMAA